MPLVSAKFIEGILQIFFFHTLRHFIVGGAWVLSLDTFSFSGDFFRIVSDIVRVSKVINLYTWLVEDRYSNSTIDGMIYDTSNEI